MHVTLETDLNTDMASSIEDEIEELKRKIALLGMLQDEL